VSPSSTDSELSVGIVYIQGSGGHKLSSCSRPQLSQFNHAVTSPDTYESQSKDQLTPLTHFTNKFLVLPKPEANLAIALNDQNCNEPWKPFTLRTPTMIACLLIPATLIALIEYINKISIKKKALFFAEQAEGIPVDVVFCYWYLPQLIVVMLGLGWVVVDLDMKQLEPYFQLSKPEGATASNSIFLHYPFECIVFVLIKAARKGCIFGAYLPHLRYS